MSENIITNIGINVEKARLVLRNTINSYSLGNVGKKDWEKMMIGEQSGDICSMLEIVDDFLHEAEELLASD